MAGRPASRSRVDQARIGADQRFMAADREVMPHAVVSFDDLPVVCDPALPAANDVRSPIATLGDLIAAIADAADEVSETQDEADDLVAATAFSLQWSLRRVTMAPPDAATSTDASESVAADASSSSSSPSSTSPDTGAGRAA